MSGALRLELPFFPLNSLIILLIRLLISLLNIYPFVLFGVCGDNDSVGDGGDGTLALFAVTFNLTRTLHGIHPYLAASGVE